MSNSSLTFLTLDLGHILRFFKGKCTKNAICIDSSIWLQGVCRPSKVHWLISKIKLYVYADRMPTKRYHHRRCPAAAKSWFVMRETIFFCIQIRPDPNSIIKIESRAGRRYVSQL